MGDLAARLEAARNHIAQLEREAAAGPCRLYGHGWRFIGGCNAGCCDTCCCSALVYECAKCGECDYGDNAEADAIRADCAAKVAWDDRARTPSAVPQHGSKDTLNNKDYHDEPTQ